MRHLPPFLLAVLLLPAGASVAQQPPAASAPTPSAPAASSPAASSPAAPAVTARTLSAAAAGTVLGRDVFDTDGDNVGRLVDVLVSRDGVPLAGVIDVGGFLGVGSRRVAVAWRLLRFTPQDGELRLTMNLTHDSAAAAPEYRGSDNGYVVIDRADP